jgi:hypothetical protein
MVPFNDYTTDIVATLVYDLLNFGVPWSQIKERYGDIMGKGWTKNAVIYHVERHCGIYLLDTEKENKNG